MMLSTLTSCRFGAGGWWQISTLSTTTPGGGGSCDHAATAKPPTASDSNRPSAKRPPRLITTQSSLDFAVSASNNHLTKNPLQHHPSAHSAVVAQKPSARDG